MGETPDLASAPTGRAATADQARDSRTAGRELGQGLRATAFGE